MADEGTVDLGIPGLTNAELIGVGGFARVYKAEQPTFLRTVAVKVLMVGRMDEATSHRFQRECQLMGTLSGHPSIVTMFDAGFTADGQPYLLMAYMPGGSLEDRIRDTGALPWRQAVPICVRMAGALEVAHRAEVIHRDVKPANILLSSFGEPQLTDFGIARMAGGPETRSGVITASLAHAAPEVIDGERPGVLADVYSLGSSLFALLAGAPAFMQATDENVFPLLMRIRANPVPDLRPRGVPGGVCAAIESAMAKDPAHRPPTAQAFGELLRRAEADAGRAPTSMLLGFESDDHPAETVRFGGQEATTVAQPPPAERDTRSPESGATLADRPARVASRRPPPSPAAGTRSRARAAAFFGGGLLLTLAAIGIIVGLVRGGDDGTTAAGGTAAPSQLAAPTTAPAATTAAPTTAAPVTTAAPPTTVSAVAGLGEVVCDASLPPIAFATKRDADFDFDIFLMDADGSKLIPLTDNAVVDDDTAWSPDGSRIAFRSRRDREFETTNDEDYSEIYVMDRDGSNQTRLTANTTEDRDPTWSPDGSMIAYGSLDAEGWHVYVMEPDGSHRQRLTAEPNRDPLLRPDPAWSPDGTTIAYVAEYDGDPEIYVIDADGGNPRRLTHTGDAPPDDPAWSPDGGVLAFELRSDIWLVNADGTGASNLTNDGDHNDDPAWSPDGCFIAYTKDQAGNFEIYVMDADGGNPVNLTRWRGLDNDASWAPRAGPGG